MKVWILFYQDMYDYLDIDESPGYYATYDSLEKAQAAKADLINMAREWESQLLARDKIRRENPFAMTIAEALETIGEALEQNQKMIADFEKEYLIPPEDKRRLYMCELEYIIKEDVVR